MTQENKKSQACNKTHGMTEAEKIKVDRQIKWFKAATGNYPTHKEIIRMMLSVANEITYRDAMDYGLGSDFRSRISELRREMNIDSYDVTVPTRYGTKATVKAHREVRV